MNELLVIESILATRPTITFDDYERLKEQATEIAHFVSQIEVTEENVKEAKKLLATLNKNVERLNRRRIDIKNEILKPYEDFANQVKDIETTVKNADKIVRDQVKEMEERERNEKRAELEQIWADRIELYDFAKVMSFDDWLKPQHLNKTQTIKKSEVDMTEYLERIEREIETLSGMDDADELIMEYKQSQDMSKAIQAVKDRKERIQAQKQALEIETKPETFLFVITGEKDRNLTELLLKENNIEFILRR